MFNQILGTGREIWFVLFTNFYGINTPAGANFKLQNAVNQLPKIWQSALLIWYKQVQATTVVFFPDNPFVRFGYQGNVGFIKWIENGSLLFVLWKRLHIIGIVSALNVWWNSPLKCLVEFTTETWRFLC